MLLLYRQYLILFLCSSPVWIWSQLFYTKQEPKNSCFWSICQQNNSNNFLIIDNNITYAPNFKSNGCKILRINGTGQIVDSLNFENVFFTTGPLVYANGYYYIKGTVIKTYSQSNESYLSKIYKIDQNLQIVSSKIVDTTGNDFISYNKLVYFNNRLYVGHTRSSTFQNYFYKLDLNLNKLDSLIEPGVFLSDLKSHGNRLLSSGAGFTNSNPQGNQVMELDTNLDVLSRFNLINLGTYTSSCGSEPVCIELIAGDIHSISPTKYAIIGYRSFDAPGTCSSIARNVVAIVENNNWCLSSKVTGNQNKNNVIQPGTTTSSMRYGKIFTTSISDYNTSSPYPPQTNTTQIFVHKTDTLGNIIWAKYFGEPNYYYSPYGIYALSDSGAVISGMRYNLTNPAILNSCEGFVMKIDKNGTQLTSGFEENTAPEKEIVSCYPSPASDKIKFSLRVKGKYDLRIYNSKGILIISSNINSGDEGVNVSNLQTGLYSFQLKSEKIQYTGKFIKE
jgi:hypothetical protein